MLNGGHILISILEGAGAILTGFFAGLLVVYILNRVPAEWLTEYGEVPAQELKDPNIKRIKENPWRWVYAAGFACLGIRLVFATDEPLNLQLTIAGVFACWVLLVIALSDLKYMIIPDQFVLLLAIAAIGFIPLNGHIGTMNLLPMQNGLWEPLLGMAIGGGAMLMTAGLGALIFKREAVGFGDVKLCAAVGLLLGIVGIIATLVVAVVASGIVAAAGLASGKWKKDDALPLGPFVCGSAMAYILIPLPLLIK